VLAVVALSSKSGERRTGSLNEIANLVDWAEIDHHLKS